MCTTDVSAAYGSVIAGASGFAQLVGVACSGTCYAEASRWSAVAISHGDAAVEDAAACRALCASTQLCEVWTHDDGECRLMRAMDASTITALGGAAEVAPPVEELACTLDALGAIGVLGAAVENATTMECCAAIEHSVSSLVEAGGLAPPTAPALPPPPPPPPAPPLPPSAPCEDEPKVGTIVWPGFQWEPTCAELLQSAIDSEGGTLASHCVSWFSQVTIGWMKTEYVRLTGASSFAPPPGVDDSTLVIDICLKTCGDVGVGRCSAPPGPPSPPKCVSELEPCNSGWCASPDGQGGTDCYAGPYGEQCSCSQGAARPVGTLPFAGQTYTQYTCCTEDSGVPTQGSSCDYPGVSASPLPPSPPCVFSPPAPPALPLCGTAGTFGTVLGANWVSSEVQSCDEILTIAVEGNPGSTRASMCGVEWMSAVNLEWMQREWPATVGASSYTPPAGFNDAQPLVDVCAHDCALVGVGPCVGDDAAAELSPPTPCQEPTDNPNVSPYADGCSPDYCTSDDGMGGTDCYAPPEWEPCSCSQGQARVLARFPWEGTTLYQYTCCTNSGLDNPPVVGDSCVCSGTPDDAGAELSPSGCRSDICGDFGEDCCAPGDEPRSCMLPGYGVAAGGTSSYEPCVPMYGESAVYQCCAYTSPPDAPPSPPDAPPSPPGAPPPPPPGLVVEIDARVCASVGCAASFAAALHASAAPHLAPLPAERCTSVEPPPPPPPPSSTPLVHDAGGTAAVSGPATCGAAFRLPFPNGLGATDAEAHAAAALYAPDGGCFARGKLYGAGAGSCANIYRY